MLTPAQVWRDYVTYGSVPSGNKNPDKSDIRATLFGVDTNRYRSVSGNYTALSLNILTGDTDSGGVIGCNGTSQFSITFLAASTYIDGFKTTVVNEDALDWKLVIVPGYPETIYSGGPNGFWLFPLSSAEMRKVGNQWIVRTDRRIRAYQGTGVTFYVGASGVDSNDGQRSSRPITVSEANRRRRSMVDIAANSSVAAQCLDGSYGVAETFAGEMVGHHLFLVLGNASDNTKVVFSPPANNETCLYCKDGSYSGFQDLTLLMNGTGQIALQCEQFANGDALNLLFNSTDATLSNQAIVALQNGVPSLAGACQFMGKWLAVLSCTRGDIAGAPVAHQILGDMIVRWWVLCSRGGMVRLNLGVSWVLNGHTVTGKRHEADFLSIIDANTAGANHFPGSIAGTADATSLFI